MRVLKLGVYLLFFSFLSCETTNNLAGGSGVAIPGQPSFSPAVQRRLRQMDIGGAINTIVSGPSVCGSELVQGASQRVNWDSFLSRSQRSGPHFNSSFGRVEFYNNSHRALPGEAGISSTSNSKYLDRKILDVIPFLAMAHKKHNQAVRVSHTTSGRHSKNSLHYSGRAIDIDPSPASSRKKIAQEIVRTLASSGKGCGYFVYVESSHIHISYKGASYEGCPGYLED